ncbi:DUF4276 family protein [Streptomyces sp. NPDC014344]|uniref:DUF4276 family protein n=1 Tax=Streptomyces sp. NPDC014344 TaxID=3364871 RepID=UPI0036F6A49F
MIMVGVLCEGQTEENMVKDFLGPELAELGICLVPTILMTRTPAGGPAGRGGVSKWAKIEKDLHKLLAGTHWAAVTTLLDYYGLPQDSPGMQDRPTGSPVDKVTHVERRLAEAIGHPRFLPHVVLHETETWVFAAAEQLGDWVDEPALAHELKRQADQAGGPEYVNDKPETAPSKRILKLYPRYVKTQDGPVAVMDLGLTALRAACPHFDEWIMKLLDLTPRHS